jgi:alpha,alpha-trehalase
MRVLGLPPSTFHKKASLTGSSEALLRPLTAAEPLALLASMTTRTRIALLWVLVSACGTASTSAPGPSPAALGSAPIGSPRLPALASSSTAAPPAKAPLASRDDLAEIFGYIERGWSELERSNQQLLAAAKDPKFSPSGGKWPVYLPSAENRQAIHERLRATMPPGELAQIELRSLPALRKPPLPEPAEPGILYLPHPYVVPGGRFNEMYGWDSYFIVRGLVRDGELERARGMADNFIYEIRHYGMILNANRSYYLSRSQPPLLTPMILAVYEKSGDKAWLSTTLPAIEQYYAFWTRPPHLTPTTGLARYHDLGKGPAPEVLSSEKDEQGRTHYDRVKAWFKTHPAQEFDVSQYYDAKRDALTNLFYVADRSMRESGYDPSHRFGPFNAGVIDYNPVCLNSLLYRMEQDTAEILRALGKEPLAAIWAKRAEQRGRAINQYLWDPDLGLYLDYDFTRQTRRNYPFATTFFPLWAGISSEQQAAKLVGRALAVLEKPGGIMTSAHRSGNQWDAPFGWAPLELIAVEGLRRYGYVPEADRVSTNFLSLVLKEFVEHRAIFEKYDVLERTAAVSQGIKFGYSSQEIGFGWTNAAFSILYDALSPANRDGVLDLDGVPVPPE